MPRLIVALIIIAHGLGHVMGFLAAWTALPMGFTERPWIFSTDVTISSSVGRAFGLLWLVAMVALVGAGLGLLFRTAWWPAVAVAGSVISLVVILPWWNTVTPGSRLGAVLVDIVTIAALVLPWRERILELLS